MSKESATTDFVEEITEELKAEIKAAKLKDDVPNFPEAPKMFPDISLETAQTENLEPLQRSGDCIQELKRGQVLFYRELTSYHKSIRCVVIFVKRVLRKLMRFLLEPMVAEINRDRELTIFTLESMQQYLLQERSAGSREQILLSRLQELENENRHVFIQLQALFQQTHLEPCEADKIEKEHMTT